MQGSISISLLLLCVIPQLECGLTPGGAATANKHELEDNDMSQDIITFDEFVTKFNKKYKNEEEAQKRRGIYQKMVEEIEKHNKLYESGDSSFRMGVNQFSDITHEELFGKKGFCNSSDECTNGYTKSSSYYKPIDLGKETSFINWNDRGKVTPIRDQGRVGTCWAFATTASIESAIAMKHELQQLSEQYLLDCDTGNNGCTGGNSYIAIDYVIENGMAFRSGYPYVAKNDTCKYKPEKTQYRIGSRQSISLGRDDHLLNALAHEGPVLVSIHVSGKFQAFRGSGIFDDGTNCTSTAKPNHSVLVIGYGIQNGKKYWLIKNSWGTSRWGDKGYGKITREKTNFCRISSFAVFPKAGGNSISRGGIASIVICCLVGIGLNPFRNSVVY